MGSLDIGWLAQLRRQIFQEFLERQRAEGEESAWTATIACLFYPSQGLCASTSLSKFVYVVRIWSVLTPIPSKFGFCLLVVCRSNIYVTEKFL